MADRGPTRDDVIPTVASGLGSAGGYLSASQVHAFAVLDAGQQTVLEHWTGRLIPGDGDWPNARQVGAAAYVDAVIAAEPEARTMLLRALATLDARAREGWAIGFAECSPEQQDGLLADLSTDAAGADAFAQVLELTYEAYYRDPSVCETMKRRTGFDSALPHLGSEMDAFDETRLDRVRALPSHYRQVEA